MDRHTAIPQSASLTGSDEPRPFCPLCGHFPRYRGNPPFTQGGLIIGITGPTGSGKTTLLQLIEDLGGTVLDCDAIYHELLATDPALLSAIKDRFPGVVTGGRLDRKALGAIVFADPQALLELNAITHAAVKAEVLHRLADGPRLAAIDAIGLFEGGLAELCQVTVAVTAPEDARIARLMARDNITEAYARSRIAAQHPAGWYAERCRYTLENNTTQADFTAKCLAFLAELGIMNAEKGSP